MEIISEEPPCKAAANGANTPRNKECNIDGQHLNLRCKIITALHSHHQHPSHLQGLFHEKLGAWSVFKSLKYLEKSAVSFLSSCLNLKLLLRSDKVWILQSKTAKHDWLQRQLLLFFYNIYFYLFILIVSYYNWLTIWVFSYIDITWIG